MLNEPMPFDLPPDLPPELRAVALLTRSLDELRAAVADLADQHTALAQLVHAQPPGGRPGALRWRDLDRAAANHTWRWLIDWVGWLVDRYQLQEEVPACWPQHPPLVEELTGLCAAWQVATDAQAPPRCAAALARVPRPVPNPAA
jgi:hypothetical protein